MSYKPIDSSGIKPDTKACIIYVTTPYDDIDTTEKLIRDWWPNIKMHRTVDLINCSEPLPNGLIYTNLHLYLKNQITNMSYVINTILTRYGHVNCILIFENTHPMNHFLNLHKRQNNTQIKLEDLQKILDEKHEWNKQLNHNTNKNGQYQYPTDTQHNVQTVILSEHTEQTHANLYTAINAFVDFCSHPILLNPYKFLLKLRETKSYTEIQDEIRNETWPATLSKQISQLGITDETYAKIYQTVHSAYMQDQLKQILKDFTSVTTTDYPYQPGTFQAKNGIFNQNENISRHTQIPVIGIDLPMTKSGRHINLLAKISELAGKKESLLLGCLMKSCINPTQEENGTYIRLHGNRNAISTFLTCIRILCKCSDNEQPNDYSTVVIESQSTFTCNRNKCTHHIILSKRSIDMPAEKSAEIAITKPVEQEFPCEDPTFMEDLLHLVYMMCTENRRHEPWGINDYFKHEKEEYGET